MDERRAAVQRVILHVDMDAFFVSVELRRRPDLVGKPVVVGGTSRRGVVAAASYEARRYGVYSAMSSARARQLCPMAIFLPGDYEAYSTVSAEVLEIFGTFTPFVEPLSLDEAFLDVTGSTTLFGSGRAIAQSIRDAVVDGVSLSCSVGVAPNKFLAKMASVEAKPRARPEGIDPGHGVFEVLAGHEVEYLHPLPVRRLWGVGPSTMERLSRLGVATIGDLTTVAPAALKAGVGMSGADRLIELANGRDSRPVETEREVKSISHEETYATDLHDRNGIHTEVMRLSDAVSSRLRASGIAARTITVKVRDSTFATVTRSKTVPAALDTASGIVAIANPLVDGVTPRGGIRLLGVAASKFSVPAEQLSLGGFGDKGSDGESWGDASRAIDRVRGRFGSEAIGPASSLSTSGVRLVRRGQRQWGLNEEDEHR